MQVLTAWQDQRWNLPQRIDVEHGLEILENRGDLPLESDAMVVQNDRDPSDKGRIILSDKLEHLDFPHFTTT
jgi:hypothetical protein